MASTPRENLRRSVRRAVHRACWRRLENTGTPTHDLSESELAAEFALEEVASSADEEIQQWIRDDEADFTRAVLISDLVAHRLQGSTVPRPAMAGASHPPPRSGAEPTRTRPRAPRSSPGISDLLDDMFAQQADSAR